MIGNISIWQLLILLLIVALVFGTKKLSTLGGDLGGAIKGFKKAMSDDEKATTESEKATANSAESNAQLKENQASQPQSSESNSKAP